MLSVQESEKKDLGDGGSSDKQGGKNRLEEVEEIREREEQEKFI